MGNTLAIIWMVTNFRGDRPLDADMELNGGALLSLSGEKGKYDLQERDNP